MSYAKFRELLFPAFWFAYGALRDVTQAQEFANWYVVQSIEINGSEPLGIENQFDEWSRNVR